LSKLPYFVGNLTHVAEDGIAYTMVAQNAVAVIVELCTDGADRAKRFYVTYKIETPAPGAISKHFCKPS
jgi:hypothetical protein